MERSIPPSASPPSSRTPSSKILEITGSSVLVLYAASDQTTRISSSGSSMKPRTPSRSGGGRRKAGSLTRGWLKASHASTKDDDLSKPYRPYYRHDQPRSIQPGKIEKYEIEVWPMSNVFKKGHRLRLDIACGDSWRSRFRWSLLRH